MQQKSVEIELQCQRPEQQIKQDKKNNKKPRAVVSNSIPGGPQLCSLAPTHTGLDVSGDPEDTD